MEDLSFFYSFWHEERSKIDEFIEKSLPSNDFPSILCEAMRYGICNGGKRIRPILTLAVARVFNGKEDKVLPAACAIEFVHSSSLILDDLPCMDNALMRRGKETCHRVFGEEIAILAAFGLLNHAFYLLTSLREKGVKNKVIVNLISILTDSIGANGLIAGQTIDLTTKKPVNFEILEYMHSKKTGALFQASAMFGAILSNAQEHEIEAIKKYSKNLGLAFQIKDDILDTEGDPKKMGKERGKDKRETNFVSFSGIEVAKNIMKELIDTSIKSISFLPKNELLIQLAKYVMIREK
ncbi:MAG: polyprenyl synthetase family protein [Candidatus Aminicenantia bacterium]